MSKTNENFIKDAFTQFKLIYIPETYKRYFKLEEVVWKDVSDVFGDSKGYLEKHYPELESFFINQLGISEKPPCKDYAEVLIELSQQNERIDEANIKKVIKIYEELEWYLHSDNHTSPLSESWWLDFIKQSILWTDKNKFMPNNGSVFVNDNPEYYALFRNSSEIYFLENAGNLSSKIETLISSLKLPYLTEYVQVELVNPLTKAVHQDLTKRFKLFSVYVLRYLYKFEPKAYHKLKRQKVVKKINALEIYTVEQLLVTYSLNSIKTEPKPRKAIFCNDDGNLYVQNDCLADTDYIAVELSKFFKSQQLKSPQGLKTFLISLFDKRASDKIEKLMEVMGIGELPDDEKQAIGWEELKILQEVEIVENEELLTENSERNVKHSAAQDADHPGNVDWADVGRKWAKRFYKDFLGYKQIIKSDPGYDCLYKKNNEIEIPVGVNTRDIRSDTIQLRIEKWSYLRHISNNYELLIVIHKGNRNQPNDSVQYLIQICTQVTTLNLVFDTLNIQPQTPLPYDKVEVIMALQKAKKSLDRNDIILNWKRLILAADRNANINNAIKIYEPLSDIEFREISDKELKSLASSLFATI
ncbi:hypothetical protein [Argonema antarcticum]|uniref:hypothetical protein n=1 Tax=Argonema antarcticum TaxID=2942763 RepID=UPI0020111E72|nr:hypothetical protein [Argonema antarcticum]MCL1474787.1 hypothetical protein [Argonema antarcticum A004/B2]